MDAHLGTEDMTGGLASDSLPGAVPPTLSPPPPPPVAGTTTTRRQRSTAVTAQTEKYKGFHDDLEEGSTATAQRWVIIIYAPHVL